MNESPNNAYSFMFADYFLALSKWFKAIPTYRQDYDPKTESYYQEYPRVIYGQPSAVFRKMSDTKESLNGRIKLPVISFFALSYRRIKERQNPYARYTSQLKDEYDPEAVGESRAAQVYEINYNVSVWTANNKSRDDLVSRIIRNFNTTLTLSYYPDPVRYPNDFIWMPFKLEDDINDASEFEMLDEKDTRDIIRTDFIISGEALLPLETKFYAPIKSIAVSQYIETKLAENSPNGQYRIDVVSDADEPLSFEINTTEKL
jgi:hypothetical protein